MVYECDQCNAALPAGARACPRCGELFEEAVPADAVVPRRGFHPASAGAGQVMERVMGGAEHGECSLQANLTQVEADIATLRSQAIVLKSENDDAAEPGVPC